MDLSKKRVRERLTPRAAPYFQKLAAGAYIGFRRGPDSWAARFRDRKGQQHHCALDSVQSDDFDDAKRKAEDWFAKMGGAVRSPKRASVWFALEAYLTDLERRGRKDAARTARSLFNTAIAGTALASLELEKASREDFDEWRDKLAKGRKAQSTNRYTRQIFAALNLAVGELGYVGNPIAWQLRSLEEDDQETAIFLDAAQRSALISAAAPAAGLFFRGLELTGARPGELASTVAKDFDKVEGTVRFASRKGKGAKLRQRFTVLDQAGRAFFADQCKNKLPGASIFTQDGVRTWRREDWAEGCRAAVAKHIEEFGKKKGAPRLSVGMGIYALRHSRISELLQLHGIDPLTVASQCGTSVAVIEKNYLRFIPHAFAEKLAGLRTTK